jgi:hypothetical protein
MESKNYTLILFQEIEKETDFALKKNILFKEINSIIYSIDLQKSNYFENSVYIIFGIYFRYFSPNTKIPVRHTKCHFEIRYGTLYNELIEKDTNKQLPLIINELNMVEIKNNIVNKFIPYFIDYFSINNLKTNYPNLHFPDVVLAWIESQDFIAYLKNN